MTTPDLTPTMREALTKALEADAGLTVDEYDALEELRDACPEPPTLEDGHYEMLDEDGRYRLRHVRGGRYSWARNLDGTLYAGGIPLPDDVSTWRRIDGPPTVTPEQFEGAARAVENYPKSDWATLSEGMKDYYRNLARKILTAAGVEVSDR